MSTPTRPEPQRSRRALDDSFASRFATILEARSMSLTDLQDRLARRGHRVSLATLSYWRSGRRQPERPSSFEALSEVEDILRLRPGRLIEAVGPSRRSGVIAPEKSLHELVGTAPLLPGLLRSLGFEELLPGLVEETLHITFDVDGEGRSRHCRVRAVYRSVASQAHRFALFMISDEPDGLVPIFGAVAGCSLHRSAFDAVHGVFVHEAVLDRPLEIGETAVVEYGITLPRFSPRWPSYEHHVVRRVDELLVWVRFDPRLLPRSVAVHQQEVGAEEVSSAVDAAGTNNVHLRVVGFGPGRAGVTWRW